MKVLNIDNNVYWMKDKDGKIYKFVKTTQWKVNIRRDPIELLREINNSLHCSTCGSKNKLTVDHDPPLSEKPWKSKVTILCVKCHAKKNNKPNQKLDYLFIKQKKEVKP